MTKEETGGILAILAEMWPNQVVTEQTVKAFHFVLEDVPAELVEHAVRVYLRGDNAFWPRAGQLRSLALESGTAMPAAEIAWDEVRRAIAETGMYGSPQWSTAALEQTVRTLGWRSICVCEEDNIGTLRAQFRNTYDRYAQAVVAGDAAPALADAGRRRLALEEAKRPASLAYLRPMALPAAPAEEEPAKEPGVPYALMKQRKRFADQHPQPAGNQEPDTLGMLQNLPAWQNLTPEHRERLLKAHAERKGQAS